MTIASRTRLRISSSLTAAIFLLPFAAVAQTNMSAAEGLFRDGRELMEKGDYAAACPKFAESQRLDPSAGTLLNLARCHEKQGKVATAWAEFLAAARLARQQNRANLADEAKDRASELEPKVSYLKVVLTERVPGLAVKIDDVALEAGALEAKIPVDPGQRSVSISAPGYENLELKVNIGAEHDMQTLNVPKLEKSKAPPPETAKPKTGGTAAPETPPPQQTPPTSQTPVLAYAVGGVGVVALGVGTAFAFMAKSAYSDAEGKCPSHSGCSQDAMDLRSKADSRANIANVGIGLGVVGIGVSAVLLLTQSPHAEKPQAARATGFRSLRLSPFAGPSSAGLALSGVTF